MNVTKETLDNLSKALKIEEAEKVLSELVNTKFKLTSTKYKDGYFTIQLCESGYSSHSYTLAGNSHLYNGIKELSEVRLSKEDEEEIRELILTKFGKAVENLVLKNKVKLKDEIIAV